MRPEKNNSSSASRFTFKKEERLSRKKLIDELFKSGSSFYLHPFRVYYLQQTNSEVSPVQVLISVPKKKFLKAVDRNKIKRLTREAYRLNKHVLYNFLKDNQPKLLIGFIYSGKKIESFKIIHEKMIAILNRLSQKNVIPEKNSE